ncbi:Ribonuclease 3 [Tolypocladium ophioglossoides CBS 100239]|uniref:Ribonuclease 3 n=1 Tax=Tolypocladium ophioglossoides (strain CBS 100239) TaxID=1163406 RepID=A0A0L0NK72_TOLOC|nr:Ribonuclease 3 [Tolypocladium ophioglossoides CBS 100239]
MAKRPPSSPPATEGPQKRQQTENPTDSQPQNGQPAGRGSQMDHPFNVSWTLLSTPWTSSEISSELPPLPEILDPELESTAFTHPGAPRLGESYERLEWHGDAYLEFAATRLIGVTFPQTSAGRSSQLRELLVRNTTLANYFRQYGMAERAKLPADFSNRGLGRGRSADKDLLKTQADMFEAFFAAIIHSDPQNGWANAVAWIRALWGQTIREEIRKNDRAVGRSDPTLQYSNAKAANPPPESNGGLESKDDRDVHPKDKLRATIGAKGIAIRYEDIPGNKTDKVSGLPMYTVGVYLDGWGEQNKLLGTGTDLKKKEAGRKAAEIALANKKLMKVYEAKKKDFMEAVKAAEETGGLGVK